MIQYSRGAGNQSRSRGVLDTRLRGYDELGQKKLPQQFRRHVRVLFRQKMPALDRRTGYVGRPFLPDIERRRRSLGTTNVAPQRQHQDREFLAGIEIGLVDVV